MQSTSNRQSPHPAPSAPHAELTVDPEEMAAQTIRYMDEFEKHGKEVREYSSAEQEQAYQALLSQNRTLPPGTGLPQLKGQELEVLRGRMEAILEQPAVDLVE